MKKIYLILSPCLPCPDVKGGAIETLVTNIIKENEKKPEVELNVISKYDKEAVEESKKYKNTNMIYIKTGVIYKILLELYKILKRFRIKMFCLNTYYYKALQSIDKDVDYIVVEGGTYEPYEPFVKNFGKDKMVIHIHGDLKSNEILNKYFGKVIGVSDFVIKNYNSAPNVTTKVLKNGIDIQKFEKKLTQEEKEDLLRKFNLNKDDFIVLFCGRLIEVKGILKLIKAMNLIDTQKIKLMIVGSPNFAVESNSKFVDELKREARLLRERVIFTGYVPNSDLWKYHQIASIQAIPSLWEDAAPLTPIEAMASGVPIVATKSGGMIEYIDDQCAKIIDKDEKIIENLKNSIVELYNDKEKCKKMSEHGIERAALFTMQKYYEDFVKLIEEWES